VLTAREVEVLELLAQGRSAVDVAAGLHIEVTTVNSHRRHIYEKLGVHDRRELAALAAQLSSAEQKDEVEFGASAVREMSPHFAQMSRNKSSALTIDSGVPTE